MIRREAITKAPVKRAVFSVAVALLAAPTGIWPDQLAAAMAEDLDARQAIVLDERGRFAVLEEMRKHLSNLQALLQALGEEEMQAVAKVARASGMRAAREADPHMQSQLPADFRKLGFNMHADFDAMSEDVEKFHDPKKALAELSAILNQCVGCHATYQIRMAPR